MFYLIELRKPAGTPLYVVEQAADSETARALVDAQLGRDDENDDITIVAVHPVH